MILASHGGRAPKPETLNPKPYSLLPGCGLEDASDSPGHPWAALDTPGLNLLLGIDQGALVSAAATSMGLCMPFHLWGKQKLIRIGKKHVKTTMLDKSWPRIR